ncbi:transglycosylase [Intrasporangium chromatireducens Q5-1]|uniref:Transglycosylase n=1 Tax=Intrasporangium chromatireducens Q5-1 TaxID=584657 RepID=W9GP73_9MICO|nr:transglycosylase [Intrasporangium chromatireducens Q5-1]
MISRRMQVIAAAGAAVLLTTGGVAGAQLDKAVTLKVDGKPAAAHVFGSTVGDLLDSEGITLASGDVVSPAEGAALHDGDVVTVSYARPVTITIDGKTQQIRTTETTVDGVLEALGVRTPGAKLSVSRSQSIGRAGLALSITTPKSLTVVADGKTTKRTVAAATVSDALAQLGVKVGDKDQLAPAADTVLTDGAKIVVKRVTTKRTTRTEPVAYQTVRTKSKDLFTDQTKVKTAGRAGERTLTLEQTLVDGKVTATKQVASEVTREAVDRVLLVGTKSRPAPTTTSSGGSSSAGSSSGGGINLARAAMWDSVAACESGGNWHINTGNGYYGGLQFSASTWLAYGGGDFASRADLASREQQITVANRVYADNGLSQWGCKA